MVKNVGELVENLKNILTQLEGVDPSVPIGEMGTDTGGYDDGILIDQFGLDVDVITNGDMEVEGDVDAPHHLLVDITYRTK